MSGIYATSTTIMFCLFCYTSTVLFRSLRVQTEGLSLHQADRLATIKRQYILACEVVDCLNDCFGWSVLLSVSSLFVSLINSSFYIFEETKEGFTVIDAAFTARNLLELWIICVQADGITKQVRQFENFPVGKMEIS